MTEYINQSHQIPPGSKINEMTDPSSQIVTTTNEKVSFFALPKINTHLATIAGSSGNNLQSNTSNASTKSFPPDNLSPSNLVSPQSTPPSSEHSSISKQKIVIVCYKLPLTTTWDKEKFEWEDIRNVLANLRVLQSRNDGNNYEVNFVGCPSLIPLDSSYFDMKLQY